MKQIYIQGLTDERYIRPLEHIGNLFFEDTKILYSEAEEKADLHVHFETEIIDNEFIVRGKLEELEGGKSIESNADLRDLAEKEIFKQMKTAISKSYLLLLQEYTGMVQKWGILTGIRPTKLLHRHMQNQTPKEEAHQSLRAEYLMSDEKINLMQKIIDRQLAVIPDLYDLKKEVSIYIGIPFCPTKCAYCTFPAYAINGRQGSVSSFLGGLHYEMEKIGEWLKEKNIHITTVYYGGGTPTSITAEEMDMLYERMYTSFPNVENIREITVEAGRPDTITPEKLEVLKKYNIDRISINPQSYTQQTLKAIGRHHTVEETIEKYHLARKHGMNNINMDLIIGLPGEGVEEFKYSLDKTEELMPESLTVHTLSFKRASEMTRNKSRYKVADRDEIQEMMKMAEEWTEDYDYVPYYLYRQKNILGNLENVGYSKKNQESIYNIMMMEELQTVIGLGCGASSKFIHPVTGKITQFSNPKHPKTYNESFEEYTDKKIILLNEHFSLEASK
ncbi:coproporphyrinogen III oxidase [Cytobacillus oceanisediminis]|uniref:Coproporphyrinogen III oxidase n=2 Tax=Niallia TaxID=2837506 RepID=A0A941GKA0_NIACI|nr:MULTISPECIES: coproporphyrinogen III oxidase [Bacillaceae]EOR25097.1 coproporphyrinogen III oxidase [Niallia nealsonii AAU1]MBQ6449230.1 coproporphyrinogen III oxidase [Bacillus sp. (in: firmicutes)]MBZ9534931.1 coproporphyrinogen III oxidase [Cytobacillus oceanisediminis]MCB5236616.1 coproporphyrinogen III oxidase [Niallia circulans]MED3792001.1 coproporphyrinogen III oxidase [Niallia alba]